jgi:hypothetical protein
MHPIASEGPGNLGSGPADLAVTLNIAQPNAPFFDINGIVRPIFVFLVLFLCYWAVVPLSQFASALAASKRCREGDLDALYVRNELT